MPNILLLKYKKGVEYMCESNHNCGCIAEILKTILILQKKASSFECKIDSCDRKVLGCVSEYKCNTRPIQLFSCCLCGSNPITMPTSKDLIDEETTYSSIFRIEKLDDCCATFRVLVKEPNNNNDTFITTNSLFTLDLRCVCAIRCLDDTFIEGVC